MPTTTKELLMLLLMAAMVLVVLAFYLIKTVNILRGRQKATLGEGLGYLFMAAVLLFQYARYDPTYIWNILVSLPMILPVAICGLANLWGLWKGKRE